MLRNRATRNRESPRLPLVHRFPDSECPIQNARFKMYTLNAMFRMYTLNAMFRIKANPKGQALVASDAKKKHPQEEGDAFQGMLNKWRFGQEIF